MAIPSPSPHLKPPVPPISIVPSTASNSQFTPRKEFIRDQRVLSSFSLLSLANSGDVRLYGFPATVINALRRLFEHTRIIRVREVESTNFFEFTLGGKPWAKSKSPTTDKILVDILAILFQHGYTFLSTLGYGREEDDRIAIAFSKPLPVPSSAGASPLPNASVATLAQSYKVPFALSFISDTVMRVVSPPLHSTPAILQAVRGAWPRGVISEKKVGDSYEFRLSSYKWYQEHTFGTDSLHYILSVLTSLDNHAFTLLTSLSVAKRSRDRDLWIFVTQVSPDVMPESPSSLNDSSLELKNPLLLNGNIGLPSDKNNSLPRRLPIPPAGAGPYLPDGHLRAAISNTPLMSSPLKTPTPPSSYNNKVQTGVLHKPPPKIPAAFMSDPTFNNSSSSMPHSPSSMTHPDSASRNTGASLDMTGIGSGGRKFGDAQGRAPDAFYDTDGGRRSWQNTAKATPAPHAAAPTSFPWRSSLQETSPPSRLKGASSEEYSTTRPRSDTPPPLAAYKVSSPPIRAPEPHHATGQEHVLGDGETSTYVRKDWSNPREPHADTPRTPTPPLLNPSTFRGSTFSASTSYEIPIAWSGRDTENDDDSKSDPFKDAQQGHGDGASTAVDSVQADSLSGRMSFRRHSSDGFSLPGAWATTPKEEKDIGDDVARMLPPTIMEHPSQEQEDVVFYPRRMNDMTPDEQEVDAQMRPLVQAAQGEGTRKSEAGLIGVMPNNSKSDKRPGPLNTKVMGRPSPPRQDTASGGWVMVNIEGASAGYSPIKGKGKESVPDAAQGDQSTPRGRSKLSSTSPKMPPPVQHTRSQSDTRIPRSGKSGIKSSMSPAAKSIVIIDAMGVKDRARLKAEKASSSGIRRMLSPKSKGIKPVAVEVDKSAALGRGQKKDGGAARVLNAEMEEGHKGRWIKWGTAPATKERNRRFSSVD